jgi:hypothetical protein
MGFFWNKSSCFFELKLFFIIKTSSSEHFLLFFGKLMPQR